MTLQLAILTKEIENHILSPIDMVDDFVYQAPSRIITLEMQQFILNLDNVVDLLPSVCME